MISEYEAKIQHQLAQIQRRERKISQQKGQIARLQEKINQLITNCPYRQMLETIIHCFYWEKFDKLTESIEEAKKLLEMKEPDEI